VKIHSGNHILLNANQMKTEFFRTNSETNTALHVFSLFLPTSVTTLLLRKSTRFHKKTLDSQTKH